ELFGFGRRLVRGEPVVHGHTALIGHDVAGDSAADVHRRQRLLVVESVDGHGTRLVRGQSGQYLGCGVDGVAAHEGPGRVGPHTRGGDVDAHRAVAAASDRGVRGFAEDREVTGQPVRVVAGDPAESVERGVDLLVVVEDPADVPTGLAQGRGRDE